jgi:hypothetical protein
MKIFNGAPSKYLTHLQKSLDASIEWTNNPSEKTDCDVFIYAATPDLDGVGHIIDAVNDSNHWKEKTVFYSVMEEEPVPFETKFNSHQLKSLIATGRMVRVNGGLWFETEDKLKQYLSSMLTNNG